MKNAKSENKAKTVPILGVRHLQVLLLFSNLIFIFISRLNVAVSVVAMTNAAKSNPDFPEYDWTEKQKSYILSSLGWGYTLMQLPAGYFLQKYGVKKNLFVSTISVGFLSLIVPFCVPWGGWKIYCALRIAQGAAQGSMYPCLLQHLAKWCPPAERNRLGGFAHSGFTVGTIIAMAMPGFIAASSLGWPGIFYITAALCFIWCGLWLVFGANDVSTSKLITTEEREYIEAALKQKFGDSKSRIPTPWRAIFRSSPFYALIFAQCTQGWSYCTILAELPSYMNAILGFDIKRNALYSALPFVACWLMSYFNIFIADFVMNRKLLSLTAMRKCFNSIAMWIPAAGLIWFGFLDQTDHNLPVVLITLIVGINSGNILGTSFGTIDLAPNHAGMLTTILNTCRNLTVMLPPLFVGVVVKDEHNRSEWQIVFTVAALVFCAGDIVFLIFGSSEQQPWNEPDFLQAKDDEEGLGPINVKMGSELKSKNSKHDEEGLGPINLKMDSDLESKILKHDDEDIGPLNLKTDSELQPNILVEKEVAKTESS